MNTGIIMAISCVVAVGLCVSIYLLLGKRSRERRIKDALEKIADEMDKHGVNTLEELQEIKNKENFEKTQKETMSAPANNPHSNDGK